MTEMFDATSRLAEGRPALKAMQDYVWACHLLGYQDADLTLHGSHVLDWYGSEDGIDLRALDADCVALRAAAAAAEEALARQDAQAAAMSVAWQGRGAQASQEFLRRHNEAATAAAAAVRTAAESLGALRDRLWRAVDEKAAATVAVGDRGARADWAAAAQTVITGTGDRATASELVDQEVKPFVGNDIRIEWLEAMRSAMTAVVDAYDAAVAELGSEADAVFDVPGDLGPAWTASADDQVAATTPAAAISGPAPVGVEPSSWSAPPVSAPLSPAAPAPPAPAAPTTAPVEPAAMASPSMPALGGGLPDIGSGLSGLGQQLGDALGGLLGTTDEGLSDLPEVDEQSELDEPDDVDDVAEDEQDEDDLDEDDLDEDPDTAEDDEAVEPDSEAGPACDPPPEEPALDVVPPEPVEPPPAEAAPTPAPIPPPAPPPAPPPEPAAATGTPCEIAADELPQVGE